MSTKAFIIPIFLYSSLIILRFYQTKPPEYPTGKEIVLSGILSEEPQVKGKTQKLDFDNW